jgi:hypothetical protein
MTRGTPNAATLSMTTEVGDLVAGPHPVQRRILRCARWASIISYEKPPVREGRSA